MAAVPTDDAASALLGLVFTTNSPGKAALPAAESSEAAQVRSPGSRSRAGDPLVRVASDHFDASLLLLGDGLCDPGARVSTCALASTGSIAVIVDSNHAIVDARFLMRYDVITLTPEGGEAADTLDPMRRIYRFETFRELHAASLDCPAQLCALRSPPPATGKQRTFRMPRTKAGSTKNPAGRIFPRGLLGLLQRDRIAAAGVSVRVMRRGDIFHQRAVYDLHQLIQAAEACKFAVTTPASWPPQKATAAPAVAADREALVGVLPVLVLEVNMRAFGPTSQFARAPPGARFTLEEIEAEGVTLCEDDIADVGVFGIARTAATPVVRGLKTCAEIFAAASRNVEYPFATVAEEEGPGGVTPCTCPLLMSDRWGDMNHSAVSGVVFGFILRLLHPRALCILPETGLASAVLRRLSLEYYGGPVRGVSLDAHGQACLAVVDGDVAGAARASGSAVPRWLQLPGFEGGARTSLIPLAALQGYAPSMVVDAAASTRTLTTPLRAPAPTADADVAWEVEASHAMYNVDVLYRLAKRASRAGHAVPLSYVFPGRCGPFRVRPLAPREAEMLTATRVTAGRPPDSSWLRFLSVRGAYAACGLAEPASPPSPAIEDGGESMTVGGSGAKSLMPTVATTTPVAARGLGGGADSAALASAGGSCSSSTCESPADSSDDGGGGAAGVRRGGSTRPVSFAAASGVKRSRADLGGPDGSAADNDDHSSSRLPSPDAEALLLSQAPRARAGAPSARLLATAATAAARVRQKEASGARQASQQQLQQQQQQQPAMAAAAAAAAAAPALPKFVPVAEYSRVCAELDDAREAVRRLLEACAALQRQVETRRGGDAEVGDSPQALASVASMPQTLAPVALTHLLMTLAPVAGVPRPPITSPLGPPASAPRPLVAPLPSFPMPPFVRAPRPKASLHYSSLNRGYVGGGLAAKAAAPRAFLGALAATAVPRPLIHATPRPPVASPLAVHVAAAALVASPPRPPMAAPGLFPAWPNPMIPSTASFAGLDTAPSAGAAVASGVSSAPLGTAPAVLHASVAAGAPASVVRHAEAAP